MRAAHLWGIAIIVLGLYGGTARSQQVLFRDSHDGLPLGAEGLTLLPLDTPVVRSQNYFLRSASEGGVGSGPDLPPFFPGTLSVDLGFQYLVPHFSDRAVALSIPAAAQNNFPVLANTSNLSNDFGFVPQFGAAYDFSNLGFGLGASGKLLSLTGSLSRTSDSDAGSGVLSGQATVNIAVANFLEGTKTFSKENSEWLVDSCFEDCQFTFTIGGRYSHVDQTFTANLASGSNTASVTATQKYDGFGPTTSFGTLCPLKGSFCCYWFSRGSFLIGTNIRDTHTSIAIEGSTESGGAKLTESRTVISPVGEFELGFAYGIPLETTSRGNTLAPLVWMKLGAVFNVWGELGLLSIADGPQHFSDGDLCLYGFNVLLGIQR